MNKFEKWKRNARRRLRAGYRGSLRQEQERFQQEAAILKAEYDRKLKQQQDRFDLIRAQDEDKYNGLVKEIAQIRLEWGPQKFGSRFSLYVRMDESFIHGVRDLKEYGPYVVDRLAMLIKREFSQIDFCRVKPIEPRYPPRGEWYPAFTIEPGNTKLSG